MPVTLNTSDNILDILAFLSGALLVLAFAPFHLPYLAPIALAGFYLTLQNTSPKQAFKRGGLFGISFFGIGIHWIYISIHTYGHAPIGLALLLSALFISVLASFPALLGYGLVKISPYPTRTRALIYFPCAWMLTEFMRSTILTGFPWLLLGHSQASSLLGGYLPVIGVIGTGGILALSGSALACAWIEKTMRLRLLHASFAAAILAGGMLLSVQHFTHPTDKQLTVSLIQGNITQDLKWTDTQRMLTLKLYRELSLANLNSDLILWPESAIPLPANWVQEYFDDLNQQARKNHTAILVGAPVASNPHATQFYNTIWLLGEGKGRYQKRKLVPFGEYLPLENWITPILSRLKLPIHSLGLPGAPQQTLMQTHNTPFASFICYESAFTRYLRRALPEAEFLVISTDDSWFGHSIAASQHVQFAQTFARLSGRPILSVGNTGITAIIAPNGRIEKRLPEFTQSVLSGTLTPYTGCTPWARWGH